MTTIIINLVGKSASGKNFHKSRLLNSKNEKIVSSFLKHPMIRFVGTATRAMRPGEVEGEDYYYISMEEHMRLRNEGQIFEVSLDTTKYSYWKSELKKLKFGGLRILETNPDRMRQIMKHLSDNGVKILTFGFDVDEETHRQQERVGRFKEHQELVSKVVKQQEGIKKKRRQKLTGEEAFERKENFLNR
uniref:guanylate kinase-like n=1 Tax=Myxine glutinosa TaxID=7769 RepID=UPI0035902EEF